MKLQEVKQLCFEGCVIVNVLTVEQFIVPEWKLVERIQRCKVFLAVST